jgi:hypothetical protein
MFAKHLMTLSIVATLGLGAVALSADGASARPGGGGGGGGGGMRSGGNFHAMQGSGMSRQVHWDGRRHRYGPGFYGAPLLVGASTYAMECYYIRRHGGLYKVCQ